MQILMRGLIDFYVSYRTQNNTGPLNGSGSDFSSLKWVSTSLISQPGNPLDSPNAPAWRRSWFKMVVMLGRKENPSRKVRVLPSRTLDHHLSHREARDGVRVISVCGYSEQKPTDKASSLVPSLDCWHNGLVVRDRAHDGGPLCGRQRLARDGYCLGEGSSRWREMGLSLLLRLISEFLWDLPLVSQAFPSPMLPVSWINFLLNTWSDSVGLWLM